MMVLFAGTALQMGRETHGKKSAQITVSTDIPKTVNTKQRYNKPCLRNPEGTGIYFVYSVDSWGKKIWK